MEREVRGGYAGWAEVAGTALDACVACIVYRLRPALTPALSRRRERGACVSSGFSVRPFLQGVAQVGGVVHLAVVFDLLVARHFQIVRASGVERVVEFVSISSV